MAHNSGDNWRTAFAERKKERKRRQASHRRLFVRNLQTAKQYPIHPMTLHSLSNWPLMVQNGILSLMFMLTSSYFVVDVFVCLFRRISSLSNKSCLVLVPETLFCMRLKSQISRKEILDLNLERVRWMEGQDQLQTNPQKERDPVSPVWKVTLVWPLGNLPLATICL